MDWQVIKAAKDRLGSEVGTIYRAWGGRIPVALIYPNSYHIGMSNLGLQTIYGLFNSFDQVVCERAFYEKGTPTISLESQRPLDDFPILAFSISYELDYLNIVHMLRSSGIPPLASDRDDRHPVIIGGGPCPTSNPEPLAPLFDALVIGEGEPVVPQLVEAFTETIHEPREVVLRALDRLPGVYVPILHKAGTGNGAQPIQRQWARNLDDFATTSVVLSRHTELGGMYLMEIARGCGRACRFCLAGYSFRPFRIRSVENLLAQAREGLKYRKRLGLVGAAVSDHPELEALLAELRAMGADVSLSSLRIEKANEEILKALTQSGTKTIALAPEAGTPRLRRIINKNLTDEQILRAVEKVAAYPIKQLKLYFILGLPTETEEDVEGMIELALNCRRILNHGRSSTQLTLNISPFVPKAGTPFQWLPMAPAPVLSERMGRIENSLRHHGISIAGESIEWSQIQALLARGGQNLFRVLTKIEQNSLAAWRRALKEEEIDLEYETQRQISVDEALPWAMIDAGIEPRYLARELKRGSDGAKTPSCPSQKCHACGVC